jgi:catechol 2,3-dioxygenase-like lactoylglutathione lyase family enzyme
VRLEPAVIVNVIDKEAIRLKYNGTLVAVSDMERSKDFYKTVLGLNVETDLGANVILTGGIFLQTLETWRNFIGKDETTFYNHVMELYFETDDFDGFVEKLCTVKLVHPPLEQSWGQRVVRLYDPDGHIVEVGENMRIVIQRFMDSGMTIAQTAVRMDVPEDYLKKSLIRPEKSSQIQKMLTDLTAEQEQIAQQLADLRAQGREKTVLFKQLFTKKLSNLNIIEYIKNADPEKL